METVRFLNIILNQIKLKIKNNLFIENKNTNFTKLKMIKNIMYKLTLDGLFFIYKLGFDRGVKRSTTVSNKILREWFDELPEIKRIQGKE